MHGGDAEAEAEADGQVYVAFPFAQVRQHQQRLPAWRQLPPGRADALPASAQRLGQQAQGAGGHRQAGRVRQHAKPLVVRMISTIPVLPGASLVLSATPLVSGMEKAQCGDAEDPQSGASVSTLYGAQDVLLSLRDAV